MQDDTSRRKKWGLSKGGQLDEIIQGLVNQTSQNFLLCDEGIDSKKAMHSQLDKRRRDDARLRNDCVNHRQPLINMQGTFTPFMAAKISRALHFAKAVIYMIVRSPEDATEKSQSTGHLSDARRRGM